MKNKLPESVVWRKDKTGFEPPQKQWMKEPALIELVHNAKSKLIQEKIIKPSVLNKALEPRGAHEADNFDWRYLASSVLFK
jgi:asparagine synthase (glutamine-hydrolysing)